MPRLPGHAVGLALLLLVISASALSACGNDGSGANGRELTVVATTTQVGDLVRRVGGDRVDVEQILTSGADPHDYEPRPSDAAALAGAAVVFRSGGDLDGWLDGLIDSAGSDAGVVELSDSVEKLGSDPHWWQNPQNAIRAVAAIRDALIEADPAGRRTYTRNAAAYAKKLERLDAQVAACIERVPAAKRKLVTTHDALAYYADRYGIEAIGSVIPSLSTQAQPSAKDVSRLVDQIEDEGVEAVFPESGISDRLEQALSREAGAEVGAPLWADTLGEEGTAAGTYTGALVHNTRALVDGMSGGSVSCRRSLSGRK
jgi:ABC-type Zn uptake system ZnuABC Zn-binding protein ZnuA